MYHSLYIDFVFDRMNEHCITQRGGCYHNFGLFGYMTLKGLRKETERKCMSPMCRNE